MSPKGNRKNLLPAEMLVNSNLKNVFPKTSKNANPQKLREIKVPQKFHATR